MSIDYTGAASVEVADLLGAVPSVLAWQVRMDWRSVTDAAMASPGSTVTSATANFSLDPASSRYPVGKRFGIYKAGGLLLYGTITAVASSTSITISAASGSSFSDAELHWGTDSTTRIQAAINATAAQKVGLLIPYGACGASNLTIPSNAVLYGYGAGSRIIQVPGTAVDNVPFITATGVSNIELRNFVIDGLRNVQSATFNVTGLLLTTVMDALLEGLETINNTGYGVGGCEWTRVKFIRTYHSAWGATNAFAGIYHTTLGSTDSRDITIKGSTFDGTDSGSCCKLLGTAAAQLYDVVVDDCDVLVGDISAADSLGIEIWSNGTPGNYCHHASVTNNRIRAQLQPGKTYGRSWAVSFSQVDGFQCRGNVVRDCGYYAYEIIGQNATVTNNQAFNSGPLSVLAGVHSGITYENVQVTDNLLNGLAPFWFQTSGLKVYAENNNNIRRVQIAGNQVILYASNFTFTADPSTDTITATGHTFDTNERVYLTTTGTLPAGLSTSVFPYYVINSAANTLKLSLTQGGAAVDITTTGTGVQTIHRVGRIGYHLQNNGSGDFDDIMVTNNMAKGGQARDDKAYAVSEDSTGDINRTILSQNKMDNWEVGIFRGGVETKYTENEFSNCQFEYNGVLASTDLQTDFITGQPATYEAYP